MDKSLKLLHMSMVPDTTWPIPLKFQGTLTTQYNESLDIFYKREKILKDFEQRQTKVTSDIFCWIE